MARNTNIHNKLKQKLRVTPGELRESENISAHGLGQFVFGTFHSTQGHLMQLNAKIASAELPSAVFATKDSILRMRACA